LYNIAVTDGTDQSHNISEIYNVRLYQATNFLNAPLLGLFKHLWMHFGDMFSQDTIIDF